MPQYFPIPSPVSFETDSSDMLAFRWIADSHGIVADFSIFNDQLKKVRVEFSSIAIVRILDEMPLSTEHENTPNTGLVPQHFAYRVEGASFWESQSWALKHGNESLKHYRLITGSTCLDVLANSEPAITLVQSDSH